MTVESFVQSQRVVCAHYGAAFAPSPSHLKVGIARNVRDGVTAERCAASAER